MEIIDILEDLAACLCQQIRDDGSPTPCMCGVVPGSAPAIDYVDECGDDHGCGMAFVRLGAAYPAIAVGTAADATTGNCDKPLGLDVELGIYRCFPTEVLPEPEVYLAAVRQQVKDMLTIRRAVACCSSLDSGQYILGTYQPVGPIGNALGGLWPMFMLEV